jgi:AbrB family looped-hinge helix DNA binding protein
MVFQKWQEFDMAGRGGFSEEPQPFEHEGKDLASVSYMRLKLDSAGRVVIPADVRAAMMVKPGDTLTAWVEDGELRLVSRAWVMRRIHEQAERFKAANPGVSLVDELIADRREEARLEDERWARLEREADELEARNPRRP